MSTYTKNEIDIICEEIELQWNYHLVVRAVFFSGFGENDFKFESPSFYKKKGIFFRVILPEKRTEIMNRTLEGVSGWLNQNYIIRLWGILDGHGIITVGKNESNSFTEILSLLRPNVGAHSDGYRNPKRSESKKAAKLICQHLDKTFIPDAANFFNLSIDTVLEPLKVQCIEFVSSLVGKEKPDRKCIKRKLFDWRHLFQYRKSNMILKR